MNQLSLFGEKEPPTDDGLWTDVGLPECLPVGIVDKPEHERRRELEGEWPKTGGPKFCAFDLEISQPFELGRPFGISCAATLTSDGDALLWHGVEKAPGATLPDRMNPREVQEMAGYLAEMQATGYPVVGWNSAGFDMSVLAEECLSDHWAQQVALLAWNHIDPWFQMLSKKGYGVGLETAGKGLDVGGKTEGMHGHLAPILWSGWPRDWSDDMDENVTRMRAEVDTLGVNPGRRTAQDLCLKYVGQDAKLTADVYTALLEQGHVYWTTQRGTQSRYPWRPETKDGRLLTVNEAIELPEVDTSWMSNPKTRKSYLEWMEKTERKENGLQSG